jgi:hypothetical protein
VTKSVKKCGEISKKLGCLITTLRDLVIKNCINLVAKIEWTPSIILSSVLHKFSAHFRQVNAIIF